MSDKPKKPPIWYIPYSDDDGQHARLEAASLAIGEFWSEQYRVGEWIRLARIADWIVARDQNSNRVVRDEMVIDGSARAVYLKLSMAIAAGFFKPIILVSSQWLVDGAEDIPARSTITIDQFKQAARSYIAERWIGPEVETDMFIAAYLQNMAITDRACSNWLSQEGYALPPWLTAVEQNPPPGAATLARPDNAPPESVDASGTKNVGGKGKMTRSIRAAFRELWPSGEIPIGMSSQDRNDKIQVQLEKYGVPTKPDKRTIERALKSLNR